MGDGVQLFRRKARVVIHRLEITGLHLAFEAQRSLSTDPNTAEIRITNLNPDHRRQLQEQQSVPVRLEAGYAKPELSKSTDEALQQIGIEGSAGLPVIFQGDLREVYSERNGRDWVTVIRSGDGETSKKQARTRVTFKPGLKWRQIVTKLVEDAGVEIGNLLSEIQGMANVEISAPLALHGNAHDKLDRVLTSFDLEWSVQNGELQVLQLNQPLRSSVVELGPDTGLIGSPEPGSDGLIKFRSLLQPDIVPGRRVKLNSESAQGLYRCERCDYIGDTARGPWYVEGEARAL